MENNQVDPVSAQKYLFQTVSKLREVINTAVGSMSPAELLIMTAYLLAILETQIPEMTQAFDGYLRPYFNEAYKHLIETSGVAPDAGFLVIVPQHEGSEIPNPFEPTSQLIIS